MSKTISSKITALTFGVLVVCFAVAFYVVAWQEPSQAPPGGNVPTPLNVGPEGQAKEGGLILNTGGAEYGLIVGGAMTLSPSSRLSSPETGQIYFDQDDQQLYYFNGLMWMRIAGEPARRGEACTESSADCLCVDGYCCDSACDTICYSCNLAGYEGYCTAISAMAEDDGCSTACVGCSNGGCINWANTTRDDVGANTCLATHYRCNGSGSCTAPTTACQYPLYGTCSRDTPDSQCCARGCANLGYDLTCGYCSWTVIESLTKTVKFGCANYIYD